MYSILKLALFLIVCKFHFVIGQAEIPPWLELVGSTSTKTYYLSNSTTGPMLDVAESKHQCFRNSMRLATLDMEAINLLNDFFISKFGIDNRSPEIWTSARFSMDMSTDLIWTTTGEPVVGIPLSFSGPYPGQATYYWYECPSLIRRCPRLGFCGSNPGPDYVTGLVHDIGALANSNCLLKKQFLCQQDNATN